MTERLYRNPTDRVIAGVAGGLATWLNIDPSLVRIAWVLLGIFSGGIFMLVYIVMMIVVPLPPPGWVPRPREGAGPGAGGQWQPGPGAWGATPGEPTPGAGGAGGDGATEAPGGWSTDQAPTGSPSSPAPPWGSPPPGGWPQPARPGIRPGNAGIVGGVILIGLGVWFLIDQYVHINWQVLWPVAVIVVGAALIVGALMRRPSN